MGFPVPERCWDLGRSQNLDSQGRRRRTEEANGLAVATTSTYVGVRTLSPHARTRIERTVVKLGNLLRIFQFAVHTKHTVEKKERNYEHIHGTESHARLSPTKRAKLGACMMHGCSAVPDHFSWPPFAVSLTHR